MGKRDEYASQLKPLIIRNSFDELNDFLLLNSNLPGPRANLELAGALTDCISEKPTPDNLLWETLIQWALIPPEDTPADSPREFIPFCAVQALGGIFTGVDSGQQDKIAECFRSAANDARWRVREAAAIGLQYIEEQDFKVAESIFNQWMDDASLLEWRAIIAALAHPPVLNDQSNIQFCFKVTERILADLATLDNEVRKNEGFRVIKQGLEYAISVFVAEAPREGFALMKRWAQQNDRDIRKILKSNLGKSRLTKKFKKQVDEVLLLLTGNPD